MREILFRGKCADTGKWVYGNRVYDNISGKVYILPFGNIDESQKVGEDGCLYCVSFEVDPETVGQYTGLKDKNGVKIFEGDIMVFRTGTTGVVVYSRQRFIWQGYPEDPHNPMGYFSGKWQDDFDVVGNIHDNAELLEVQNDA